MTPQFVDISGYQGAIDFVAYCAWARQWDGISRIAIKATEGIGFIDPRFQVNRQAAIDAGIDCIYFYHFARPDLGNNPADEAKFMQSVVGTIRNSDMIILDYEVQSPLATATWALAWLTEFGPKYGKLPGLYASSAFIQERLQNARLARFPLWLANWQFTPDERPACPAPWSQYEFVQYTDKAANVPGIAGTVDANIFLGGETPMTQVPAGWSDDGTTLKASNGHTLTGVFRNLVLTLSWDPANVPQEQAYECDPVEEYYKQTDSKGARVTFLFDEYGWTASRGVYRIGIGNELLGCRKERNILRAQIAALQALPSVVNLLQINSLASQIVQKSKVQ